MHTGDQGYSGASVVIRWPNCCPLSSESLTDENVTTPAAASSQPPSSMPGHFSAPDPYNFGKKQHRTPESPPIQGQRRGKDPRYGYATNLETAKPKRGRPVWRDRKGTEITLSQYRAPHLCRHNTSGPNKSLKPVPCQLPIIMPFYSQAPLDSADHRHRVHLIPSFSAPHLAPSQSPQKKK